MTLVELIEAIAADTGVPKSSVALVMKSFKAQAMKALKNGENVVLTGFGTFLVKVFKKAPLFGKPPGKGTWTKVRFQLSRRRKLWKS